MSRRLWALMAMAALLATSGCVGLIANIAHVIKGADKASIQFDQLSGKRVAVICVSATDSYGGGSFPLQLAAAIHSQLRSNVRDIEMVSQDALADWTDRNDWTQSNYLEIGRGVRADYVVVVELNTPVRLKEGPSLHKGHADFTTAVYEVAKSQQVFRKREEEYSWPAHARYGLSDREFERAFLLRMATSVARYFYAYEAMADVAGDASEF